VFAESETEIVGSGMAGPLSEIIRAISKFAGIGKDKDREAG